RLYSVAHARDGVSAIAGDVGRRLHDLPAAADRGRAVRHRPRRAGARSPSLRAPKPQATRHRGLNSPDRTSMQSKELGLAIVGSGRIGGLRGRLAAGHPAVRFIAVSDQDPAKARDLAQEIGAQVHSGDNDEIMARPEVNAVIVSTSEG